MSDHHDAKIKGRCAKVWEKDYPLSIEGELLFLHLNLQLSGNVQEIKIDSWFHFEAYLEIPQQSDPLVPVKSWPPFPIQSDSPALDTGTWSAATSASPRTGTRRHSVWWIRIPCSPPHRISSGVMTWRGIWHRWQDSLGGRRKFQLWGAGIRLPLRYWAEYACLLGWRFR